MYKSFSEIRAESISQGSSTISVAVAQDKDVLEAIKIAGEMGLSKAILVGDKYKIKSLLDIVELKKDITIIHENDEKKAALKAVELVKYGEAQVLMKGLINSSDFLKSVLDPDIGLKKGRILNHLAAFEIKGNDKLVFHTDGGINIQPTLEQKKEIIINSLQGLKAIGIKNPKVALLSANEKVNSKMISTVDAYDLVKMRDKNEIHSGILEGPIALDVAISPRIAECKGIKSEISGDVDLFVVPNIEAGNLLGKALIHYVQAKTAGIVLGTLTPIVMTSRAETFDGKLNSIALASLIAKHMKYL